MDSGGSMRMKVWNWIFATNLIIPLLLGGPMQGVFGWFGLGMAVASWWWAGRYVCARNRVVGRALLYGGGATGLSQVGPILQIYAGFVALTFVSRITSSNLLKSEDGRPIQMGFGEGFFATLFTGALLIAVALIVGLFLSWAAELFSRLGQTKPVPLSKPLFDPELDRLAV